MKPTLLCLIVTMVAAAQQPYKNLQVLPAEKLMASMQFMSAALGVACQHCHVQPFEKDERPAKEAARRMIRMTRLLNEQHFAGAPAVTCNTCHGGRTKPVGMPSLDRPAAAHLSGDALPSVDAILDRYVESAGGREAIERIATRLEKGQVEMPGRSVAIERLHKATDRLLMTTEMPNGPTVFGFDGVSGWERMVKQNRSRRLPNDELDPVRTQALFPRELRLKQRYARLTPAGRDRIGDGETYVIQADADRLVFDARSGLLIRIDSVTQSPLGPVPSRLVLEDYREVDGVQVPFVNRWVRSDVELVLRFDEVRHNVAAEDARFRLEP